MKSASSWFGPPSRPVRAWGTPGDSGRRSSPTSALYDAFYELLSPRAVRQLRGQGDHRDSPLAYMRGRTLNDSFIIPDEAQNTTLSR